MPPFKVIALREGVVGVAIEFTKEELYALIDVEEEWLTLRRPEWKVGEPHPLGPVGDTASEKIRDAFSMLHRSS